MLQRSGDGAADNEDKTGMLQRSEVSEVERNSAAADADAGATQHAATGASASANAAAAAGTIQQKWFDSYTCGSS